jgi:hypothetical protein
MRVRPDGPQLISQMVRKYLGIDCSVLMGANIAKVRVLRDRPLGGSLRGDPLRGTPPSTTFLARDVTDWIFCGQSLVTCILLPAQLTPCGERQDGRAGPKGQTEMKEWGLGGDTHVQARVCTRGRAHTPTHMHDHTRAHTHTHRNARSHTHARARAHTHTHTHTHAL